MSTETNEVFDMSEFNADGFSDAKPFIKYDHLKDGEPKNENVTVQVQDIRLKKNDEGKMSVNWTLTVLDGSQPGATAYKRINITKGNATSYRFLLTDLLTSGIKTSDLNDLNKDEVRSLAKGKLLAASIVVQKDTRFYDVKLQREVKA